MGGKLPLTDNLSFTGLEEELARDEPTFDWPQRQERPEYHDRQADEEVHPKGRTAEHFQQDGEKNGRDAGEQLNENCWPVRRIRIAVVQTADFALFSHRKKAVEDVTLAAARTLATKARLNRLKRRPPVTFGIDETVIFQGNWA